MGVQGALRWSADEARRISPGITASPPQLTTFGQMDDLPHFITAASWSAAAAELAFAPTEPGVTAGRNLESIRIHSADHKRRPLPIIDRTLEAHYGTFVVSQRATPEPEMARRLAIDTSYGADPTLATIGGHEGRAYDHGPEPDDDDPDGRMPAVVTWADGAVHHLVASHELPLDELVAIARSIATDASAAADRLGS